MKITAWNPESRLSRFATDGKRGSPEHIVQGIEVLDADVVFLADAYDGDRPMETKIRTRLEKLGYELFEVAYGELQRREDSITVAPHMMLLSRLEVVRFEELPLVGGIRNMLSADIIDPETREPMRYFGVHLDDCSEKNRLKQIADVVPLINQAAPMPVVASGDFNAMHGDSLPARIFGNKVSKFVLNHAFGFTGQRVSEMTIGDTLRYFEENTGLIDADPHGRLTMTPKSRQWERAPDWRVLCLDYMYTSPNIMVSNFKVAHGSGSDHRAISAHIETTGQNR